ncbi:hypothetical protein H0H87_003355 [Tephrocybe sp. NHM501043]|nr:hypothetical protein H0H87_003355 [Tephrocybe sp. NHM501043]
MARILLDHTLTDHLVSIVNGVWHTTDETGSIFLGGSAFVCGVSHVRYTFNFTGTSIALFGHVLSDSFPSNDTVNEVLIDTWTSVNIYLPTSNTVDLWYESPTLPDTNVTHNITFVDFPTMLIDFALVTAGAETSLRGQTLLVDETDSAIDYSGSWARDGGIISGNVTTSRAPVGGSISGTNDHNATAIFRFAGTSIAVYGISPSLEGVIMDFTLDGRRSSSNWYNASIHDPNFLWFSEENLTPGNHTLLIEFAESSTNSNLDAGEKFTLDYITYVPSFETIATKPDFASHSRAIPPSGNIHRKVVIGAVVGSAVFAILLSVLLYWRRRRAAVRRSKRSLREAIPYALSSPRDSGRSTGSLLPSNDAPHSLERSPHSGATDTSTSMLEVQRKPRLPGRSSPQRNESNPFLHEIHKPPLHGRSVTTITTDSQSQPTPIQEQHKPSLPGQSSRDLTETSSDYEVPAPLREYHKTFLPGQSPRPLPNISSEPRQIHIQEHHKSLLPGQTARRLSELQAEEHVQEPLLEHRKSSLPHTTRSSDEEFLHEPLPQEARKPLIPRAQAGPSQPVQRQEDTSPIQVHRKAAFTDRGPLSAPIPHGFEVESQSQSSAENTDEINHIAPPAMNVQDQTSVPLREHRKPRLTVRAITNATDNHSEPSVPRSREASPHELSSPQYSFESPIIHSAGTVDSTNLQNPTSAHTRTRWWRLRRSQQALVEPFMLQSPGTSSDDSLRTPQVSPNSAVSTTRRASIMRIEPFTLASPTAGSESSPRTPVATMRRVSGEPHASPIRSSTAVSPSSPRQTSPGAEQMRTTRPRIGGVRQMIEVAHRRLTMLENHRRERDEHNMQVPPPPYQPES